MLWGDANGCELELRAGRGNSRRLLGRFPYDETATLSDGGATGRPKKEEFAPRALAYRVEQPDEDIHILVGHDYDRPLASRGADSLDVKDSDDALTFAANILPEVAEAPYGRDFLGAFAAGLIRRVSPGFRIPPPATVPNAEKVEEEDPKKGRALIRTIFQALLYEMSMVTVAAYRQAMAEQRNWNVTGGGVIVPEPRTAGLHRTLNRWRA